MNPKIIHQPHDKLWKKSMLDVAIARDFFLAHVPQELLSQMNLDTLKCTKNTFITREYRDTESDVIYQIEINGCLGYFYILCEHQSGVDHFMALRLLSYELQLIDFHRKQNPTLKDLPIIYPIVVYSGEKPWTAPRNFFELYGDYAALAKDLFCGPYSLIDICRESDEKLKAQQLSGLVQFALKHRCAQDLAKMLKIFVPWLDKVKIFTHSDFIKTVLTYLYAELTEDRQALFYKTIQKYGSKKLGGHMRSIADHLRSEGIRIGTKEGIKKGIVKGRKEGIKKGMAKGVAKGIEKGMAKGRKEATLELLNRLIEQKIDFKTIMKLMRLTKKQIDALYREDK